MEKKLDKITPRNENFSKWYTDVVLNADLIDYGAVKGTIIFKPYGFAIWENIQKILDSEFKKNNVKNVYFPMLIPEKLFKKEVNHIEGFSPEVLTVTKVGDVELTENLFIRPTSEVLFSTHFAKEVKSYRDLPLLYNQWVNVMRWEKTTRPFLRTSEFLWQEGHTVHSTEREAREFTLNILNIYQNFSEKKLMLAPLVGKKTEKEKFAGAVDTYTIESLMYDGQALQCGTSHYLGTNFSKVYNIKYQDQNSEWQFAHYTSWGVSTRLIGGLIMTHSDDSGLVLPSSVAPTQIMIILVKNDPKVIELANIIKSKLVDEYRVDIDHSDRSFGFKMANAEIKGIPLRIEIGLRDVENNSITISNRSDKQKHQFALDQNFNAQISSLINEYDVNLYQKALLNRQNRTSTASSIAEYQEILKTNPGFVLVPFCGEISCETEIKAKTSTNSRCIMGDLTDKKIMCFNCDRIAKYETYFARSY